jgi:hypothetical protein
MSWLTSLQIAELRRTMILEQHEIEFLKGLERVFDQWLCSKSVQFPMASDEYGLICFYELVIKEFLSLDLEKVEDIFAQKYQSELVSYFIDHYDPAKLPVFIAFIAHLVLA